MILRVCGCCCAWGSCWRGEREERDGGSYELLVLVTSSVEFSRVQ
jgi:hypothetical protein